VALSVEDRFAVHELIALHGHLMDAGEFHRLPELFSPDVVYDLRPFGAGQLHGCGEIAGAARQLGDGNPLGHHVTNIVVTEDADGTVRAVSKGLGVTTGGTVGSVVYQDVLCRTEQGWRICHRTVLPRRRPLHR
jgi:hypothetical protein